MGRLAAAGVWVLGEDMASFGSIATDLLRLSAEKWIHASSISPVLGQGKSSIKYNSRQFPHRCAFQGTPRLSCQEERSSQTLPRIFVLAVEKPLHNSGGKKGEESTYQKLESWRM